jgi:hypothetical protein
MIQSRAKNWIFTLNSLDRELVSYPSQEEIITFIKKTSGIFNPVREILINQDSKFVDYFRDSPQLLKEAQKQYLITEKTLKFVLTNNTTDYAFQLEQGNETLRFHYQGLFTLPSRKRKSTVLKEFHSYIQREFKYDPWLMKSLDKIMQNFTIEPMKGKVSEALSYVTKDETRFIAPVISRDLSPVTYSDVETLYTTDNLYKWQVKLLNQLCSDFSPMRYTKPDDRSIIWITDTRGSTGKSKFVKFMCLNLPNTTAKVCFGTSQQLRSALIAAGPRVTYFIDMPRTLGRDDVLNDLISVLEDLKNGFIVSSMYGKYQSLMMDPPHIVVFSNQYAPVTMMSQDRWTTFTISNNKELTKN